jgi:hypothetical protein
MVESLVMIPIAHLCRPTGPIEPKVDICFLEVDPSSQSGGEWVIVWWIKVSNFSGITLCPRFLLVI